MAEETTNNITGAGASTSAGDGNKTEATNPGAVSQTAKSGGASGDALDKQPGTDEGLDEQKVEFTEEQKKAIEGMVKDRLEAQRRSAVAKAEADAKKESDRVLAESGEWQKLATQRDQELAQAQGELKAERLTNAVLQEAATHNVTNTRALLKLVRDEVEYDAEGKPSNLRKLVEQAIKDVPGLAGAPTQEQAQTQPPGTMKVDLPANNPARTGQLPDGPVSLFTPGLFKGPTTN